MKKNIYYTFLCFFVLNVFMVHSMLLAQVAPESNPHRGMYLDHFLKILPSGEIDQAFSVLSVDTNRDGIFEREDAILEYCAQNHITYIAPYDMGKILGRNRTAWNENTRQYEDLEKHFCRFIQKAKNEYCIDQIGAIAGNESFFDSLMTFTERYPPTEPYRFRQEQLNSPVFNPALRMAENTYPDGSREQRLAEFIKFYLRLSDLNRCAECGANIDVLNVELEFWYTCASDYQDYADLINYMYSIKQLHNNLYPLYPVFTEDYLANLVNCTTPYSITDVAHLCDGCSNCSPCANCGNPHPKIIDREQISFLTGNPNYYVHSYTFQFADSLTADSTDFHPLLYAESIDQGGFADYLGSWFPLAYTNNIFTAEMLFYGSWRNHPYTQINSPHENVIQPGGAMWFSKSYMFDALKNPLTFYSTSPRCNTAGTAQVIFNYIGPPETGIAYSFWISRDSDSVSVYPYNRQRITGISTSYLPPIGTAAGRKSIEFADTSIFPVCILPIGRYTAHLRLEYEGNAECGGYQCDQQVLVAGSPKLSLWGDSIFCEGSYSWLRATPGSGYQWYRDGRIIPGAVTLTYKATQTGHYSCFVTNAGGCGGLSDTIYIQAKPNPMMHLNAHCNGNNTVTIIANATDTTAAPSRYGEGGVTYQWNTGETTDRITVPFGRLNYSVTVTDPYTGCIKTDDVLVTDSPVQSYSLSIQADSIPATSCSANGALHAVFNPANYNPVSYVWSTGEKVSSIQNLYPGTYTLISTVYDVACSYFASYTIGTVPTGGPVVNPIITPVSCDGEANGSIQLNLSGGSPPFRFEWKNIPKDSVHDPSNQNQSDLFPGTYTVYIYDANACRFEEKFIVPVSNNSVSVTITSVSPVTLCSANNDGSATVAGSGGNSPYQYQWNDPLLQTTATAVNLSTGSRRVVVTDANGCSVTALVSIPGAPPMAFIPCDSNVTWLNCSDDSSGFLKYCVVGGTAPFTVSLPWTMPDSFQVELRNIPVGVYSATITDANGCTFTQTEAITAPAPVSIQTVVQSTTCIGCNNGSIQVQLSGGIAPYSWSVFPNLGNISDTMVTDLPAGIYVLCARDTNGCEVCDTVNVAEDPTGINSLPASNLSFELYPNPSSRSTHFHLSGTVSGLQLNLVITDLTGRTILNQPLEKLKDVELYNVHGQAMYLVGIEEQNHKISPIRKKWLIIE